jgi:hypothetical protein
MVRNHVRLTHGTKICQKEESIRKNVLEDAKEYFGDKLLVMKNDQQFVIDVCNFIENEVGKKKINKKDLALEALRSLFDLDDEDVVRISASIDVFQQNKLIKKDKLTRTLYRSIKSVVLNFFFRR